jgi:mono/diheme cytochrome c family protein
MTNLHFPTLRKVVLLSGLFLRLAVAAVGDRAVEPGLRSFLAQYCSDCHDAETKKGGLDLGSVSMDLNSPRDFGVWVAVHDRVGSGEMPPPNKKRRPKAAEAGSFTNTLGRQLTRFEEGKARQDGRAPLRRLNRYEYEETLRDVLAMPFLEVKGFLPEDSLSHGFNKLGDALDVSHVQMSRYLSAADHALREAVAPQVKAPQCTTQRYYAWEQGAFFGAINLAGPLERRTFPLVGLDLQREIMAMDSPKRPDGRTPERREREGMGVVVSTYEPTEVHFDQFRAPISGRYRLRLAAYSFWIDRHFTNVTTGRRDEPVTLYSDAPPRILRKLGSFDIGPNPTVRELDVYLLAGETVLPDAARLHRSRPPDHKNPLATPEGMPGVAFQWLEVEGPIVDAWPPASHQVLFGGLPLVEREATPRAGRTSKALAVGVTNQQPETEIPRLMQRFMDRVYRMPVDHSEVERFAGVVRTALKSGHDFTEAMLAGYSAVLCSPEFLYFQETTPGRLTDRALAERLSYFLWNSEPDAELRQLAGQRQLHRPEVLRRQTERMLDSPKSRRFVDAFLDYWLDLRGIAQTAPDTELYPDYQLDDLLVESMTAETQLFFVELLRRNLGITNLVTADFAILNERLATLYGLEGVQGVGLRTVPLPPEGVRGGLLTQAAVLKVTANGTSTSPVKRGAWVMSRIVGRPPPPPPPSVPAVEPDIRGATTIRDQLALHRTQESCRACHRLIDPAGFALESFDVMGAWRERYRAVGGADPVPGIGHNGVLYHFSLGPPVDPSGELPDGRTFADVRQLKRCLATDPAQLTRNLATQLLIYSTGAPVRFSDRPVLAAIVNKNRGEGWRVRSLVHDLVQSDLFLYK